MKNKMAAVFQSVAVVSFDLQCPVSYTILSVKQERIMEELDDEAKINIIRGPRTGANS